MNLKETLFTNYSNRQVLAKNTFWLGLIEVFSKVIMFVVTISVGRYLGLEGFGTFNFIFSYVGILMIFSDLGINTVLTREIAKHHDQAEQYLGNALGIKVATSLFIIILAFFSKANFILVLLAAIFSLSQQFQGLFISVLTAHEKMEYVFASRLVYYLGILSAALLVVKFDLGISFLIAGYLLVGLISIAAAVFFVRSLPLRLNFRWEKNFWQELFIESLPLFGFIACSQIYLNLDTLLIGKFFGSRSVGLYSAAYKILFAFQSINLINGAAFPRITILIHENKLSSLNRLIRVILGGSLVVLIPLALVISLKSELIIGLIWPGANFLAAAPVLSFLIWSGVVNYFRIFTTNLLVARSQQKYVFFAILSGLLVNAALNYFAMPHLGFTFAAVSLLISETVILFVSIIPLRPK